MSITAPLEDLDIDELDELEHEIRLSDDLVIAVDQPLDAMRATTKTFRDPVIPFLYLGILSLIAIIASSAYLAL